MVSKKLERIDHGCYQTSERRAAQYFQSLMTQVGEETYVSYLTRDFRMWKKSHTYHSFFSNYSRRKINSRPKGYDNYLQWLKINGKLDDYLDRSISYIFMRDLGKTLESSDTRDRVQRVVQDLKNHLNHSHNKEKELNMAWLYRLAQKERVESTFIWLLERLKSVRNSFPEDMDAEEAQRKLIKIIAGVVMQAFEELERDVLPEVRKKKLEKAIRFGYCYGLTYPFIDDLLDANLLSKKEKECYSDMVHMTLSTGVVPELGKWPGKNKDFIQYIHSELKEAFEYIKSQHAPKAWKTFLEQSYVFYKSQEVDRKKELSNGTYTNEEIYIPVILKSASSRLIVRSLINAPKDERMHSRTFFYGIYNQLSDDFTDMFEDMKEGRVTPYTYYLTYYQKRTDLINPFELYWTVISNLIHQVYHSDKKTCNVILTRAINGLKRFKERIGDPKYEEMMKIFSVKNAKFQQLLQQMVQKADNVDFFDKLLRDYIITTLRNNRKEQEGFIETIETARDNINKILPLSKEDVPFMNEPIIDAANFSLNGSGKRLRPIIAWVMGINEYRLDHAAIAPLLKSLEYMHTASLIFDDLPSQDNAYTRRGRPTIHQLYNVAIAELAGLFLTQKAVEEQASLKGFSSDKVLQLIRYSARITADMCRGQAMDLQTKKKKLTLEELNTLCKYKTALGFEAALVMPAILAGRKEVEIQALKNFGHHAGIAFQIKDDLLDVEGDKDLLGKPTSKDIETNSSTFVSVLGMEDAKKAMWEHYCLALEALLETGQNSSFLKYLLNYFINRNH